MSPVLLRCATAPRHGPAPGFARRFVLCVAFVAGTAAAHEGHDHDTEAARGAPVSNAPGGARFSAASDLFELVGALDARRLVLWLDRAADTSPVADATLELEFGGRPMRARPVGDTYVIEFEAPLAPGRVTIVASVVAGADSDLLAAELVVPAPAGTAAPTASGTGAGAPTPAAPDATTASASGAAVRTALIAAAASACAALVGWGLGRRRRDRVTGSRP